MSSVAQDNVPLSALAQSLMDQDVSPSPRYSRPASLSPVASAHRHHVAEEKSCGYGWWAFIFYFLVFALVFYFLYFALRPSFVLNQCHDSRSHSSDEHDEGEINNGKLLAAAVISALILLFVVWIFWYACSSWY